MNLWSYSSFSVEYSLDLAPARNMSSQGPKQRAVSPAVNRVVANAASVRKPNQRDGQTPSPTTTGAVTTNVGAAHAASLLTRKRTLLPDESAESKIPCKTRNIVGKSFADEVSFVFFDLETGGFQYLEHDILQISAVCGDKELNVYLEPTQPIPREASNVNKLTAKRKTTLRDESSGNRSNQRGVAAVHTVSQGNPETYPGGTLQ